MCHHYIKLTLVNFFSPIPWFHRKYLSKRSEKHLKHWMMSLYQSSGQWSSGYDVALTTRRSPVQFRPGPLPSFRKDEFEFSSGEIQDF